MRSPIHSHNCTPVHMSLAGSVSRRAVLTAVTLEKLTVTYSVKKFPTLHKTRRFIIVITTFHPCSCPEPHPSSPRPPALPLRLILILFPTYVQVFPVVSLQLSHKTPYAPPAHLVLLYFLIRATRDAHHKTNHTTHTRLQQSRYSTAQGSQYIQNRNGQLDKHVEHVPPYALAHVVLILSDKYRLRLPAAVSPRGWEFGRVGHVKTSSRQEVTTHRYHTKY